MFQVETTEVPALVLKKTKKLLLKRNKIWAKMPLFHKISMKQIY